MPWLIAKFCVSESYAYSLMECFIYYFPALKQAADWNGPGRKRREAVAEEELQ